MQATANRIAEIRQMMTENPDGYWRNEKVQTEFQDLLAAQEKLGRRAA
jgi:hypothetical protein